MRIAYVCVDPGIPVYGTKGASVHIQELVREYRALGHEVEIHATRIGSDIPADLATVPVVEYPIDYINDEDREQRQKEVSSQIAAALNGSGIDLVHERYSLFSTALAEVMEARRIPGILEVNAPLIDEQLQHRVLIDEEGARQALAIQASTATTVICVSDPVSEWVRQRVPDAQVVTIPNGVSTTRIQPVTEDPDQVIVTFVGTLKPWHGVEDLLHAASIRRGRWNLRIIGDGPQRQALEAMADESGLTVDFRGAVRPDDIMSHLEGSAIAVAPYPQMAPEDSYFSPLKVYEYMAAGLPIVASEIGQIPSVLDGVGLLVPPSNPEALAEAIDHLSRESAERRRRGALGRLLAVERHSWANVVDAILKEVA
ncbi:MAG: glycosyltransferase family 4 protein [Actinomycetaceae bacterium]|nr:glycosyltransferase family 4 protein [Actinomycetaceae bacterium]